MLTRIIGEDFDLEFITDDKIGRIKADPGQIEQVLVNLVVNARDAVPDGGKLVVETANMLIDKEYAEGHADAHAGEYVMLAVSDNGDGMDVATLERIFEPFFTTKEMGRGTGLGLATVYGIVKQNKGFINVYSELGRGTTFKIYWPLVHEEIREAGTRPALTLPDTGTATVLLVEDEEALRRLTRRMLEERGYTIFDAADGAEAVRLFEEHAERIDLLLTDVVMPGMNGRQLRDRLLAAKPELRTLFMSGYTENVIAKYGVLKEGMHFIQKPFSISLLVRRMEEVLAE